MRLDKFLANAGVGTRKEVREILKKMEVHKLTKILMKYSWMVKNYHIMNLYI